METHRAKVHTTINLSKPLMREALELFKDKSKTEIIHEALKELIRREKIACHVKKWAGKAHIRSYG